MVQCTAMTYNNDPVPLHLPPDILSTILSSPLKRLITFLGHYDLRVFLTDTAYVDVGRGSTLGVLRVEHINSYFHGCIGKIGQFCEFARSSLIFSGGEHNNIKPVNVTFTGLPVFKEEIDTRNLSDFQPATPQPFQLGNAVVLSAYSRVRSGSVIEDGSLIAAGAYVTQTIGPFSVVGGIPAKHIKHRLNPETIEHLLAVRWWDFDTIYLLNNLDKLQFLATDRDTRHVYQEPTPRLVIRLRDYSTPSLRCEILGFLQDGKDCPLSAVPNKMMQYLQNLSSSGPFYWLANAWL